MSIFRDYGKHKFNAAYSYGGVELLYKTILSNFGVSVQGYAIVDFEAFRKVVDTLGGVEINLTEEEHSILMSRYHRTSVLKLKPGINNMNGTQRLHTAGSGRIKGLISDVLKDRDMCLIRYFFQ